MNELIYELYDMENNRMPARLAEYLYQQISADIQSRTILVDDQKLMTESMLCRRYNVATGTLRKVIGRLVEENVLVRMQGCGTFLQNKTGVRRTFPMLRFSALYSLHCQHEIDSILLDRSVEKYVHHFQLSPEEILREMKTNDLLFFSPVQIFHARLEEQFFKMPDSFRTRVEQDFAPEVLDCFRSTETGELFAFPVICNPVVFYLNEALFAEKNIPLPGHDWTWAEFLDISLRLKAEGILPLLLLPIATTFFEPFLKQAGGCLFDRYGKISVEQEPFREFYCFLLRFFQEQMVVNGYLLPRSYPLELGDRCAAMSICHPYLGSHLPPARRGEWSYWELPRHKKKGGSLTTFGLGVPCGAKDPAMIWEYLEKIVYKRCSQLAYLSGAFPARRQEQHLWQGAGLRNPGVCEKEALCAVPIPYKYGEYYGNFMLESLMEHMEQGIDAETARRQLIQTLHTNIKNAGSRKVF